ncbi:MAG TPA: hypothetical protein VEO54_16205 [Thermoanaerobaculia bacterium]|nr:hypothetical protein [Thermoanaerobaculia bacterium]
MQPQPKERRRSAPFLAATAMERLRRVVDASLGAESAQGGAALIAALITRKAHDRAFAAELMEIARGAHGDPWPVRRLACLALEQQFLRVARPDDLLALLDGLALLTDTWEHVRRVVLQEGYSSVTVLQFAAELRKRIGRYEHVHNGFARDPLRAAADFVEHSRHECRLALSRYLLPAADVVEQILAVVRTTAGLPHLPKTDPYNLGEARRAIASLPPYEREILELLLAEPLIYWVAEETPSTVHSLVEYPIGTIVLAIKPPGSDLEIQIKRAGCRGERAIDCVYQREGEKQPLPVHHHFWGASTGRLLQWELSSGGMLARMHRLVYGTETQGSRTVALSGILEIPTPRGDVSLVSYFGTAQGYGRGFGAMREAMKRVLPRLEHDRLHARGPDLGGYETLGRWLAVTSPEQAFVVGTSSFRFERLAAYLAPDGDDAYFERGLGVDASDDDRRRFADAVMGEIVPHYRPPAGGAFRSWQAYLEAAYAANRAEADATFIDVLRQVGRYFGFFTALRIWSEGESFVTRNVGLRNVFTNGEWRVRVHFHDHDSVSLPGRDYDRWAAQHAVRAMRHDLVHILGGTAGQRRIPGEVAALRAIYRVSEETAEDGLQVFRQACRDAYFQAQEAVEKNEALRKMVTRGFLRELRDWDDLVRGWAEARPEGAEETARWRSGAAKMLRARDYTDERIDAVIGALLKHAQDVERYTFLYRPELVR